MPHPCGTLEGDTPETPACATHPWKHFSPNQAPPKAGRWREEATPVQVTRHLWPPSTMRSQRNPRSHLGATSGSGRVRGRQPRASAQQPLK